MLFCDLLIFTHHIFFVGFVTLSQVGLSKSKSRVEIDGGWTMVKSGEFHGLGSNQLCPFPILDARRHTFKDVMDTCFMAQQPCLIKNGLTGIPAVTKKHWSREIFLRRYGKLQVKADSRSNLPFAQGESSNKMTLKMYLNRSRTYLRAQLPFPEFVFDFFDAMKADYVGNKKMTKLLEIFLKDIPVPRDHRDNELFSFFQGHSAYRMLSLGGNAGGINFHYHGDTWLALVHGIKSWYIYPPGKMPRHVHKQLNLITSNWKKVSVDNNKHGKPIYCQQRGGQILYLPQLFLHATYNHGEAVAFGGQYPIDENVGFKTLKYILRKRYDPIASHMVWVMQNSKRRKQGKKPKKFPFEILDARPHDLLIAIDAIEECLKSKRRYNRGRKILKRWIHALNGFFQDIGDASKVVEGTVIDATVLASSYYAIESRLRRYDSFKKLRFSWAKVTEVLEKRIHIAEYKTFFEQLEYRYKTGAKANGSELHSPIFRLIQQSKKSMERSAEEL